MPFEEKELTALIPDLRRFCTHLTKDPEKGKDLAQDTLMKALQGAKSFQQGTNLKAWLFTIAVNKLRSDSRRSWRASYVDDTTLSLMIQERANAAQSSPHDILEAKEIALTTSFLSAEKRDAVLLLAAGLDYAQTAEAQGIPVGTVKSRVSRARRELSELTGNFMDVSGTGQSILTSTSGKRISDVLHIDIPQEETPEPAEMAPPAP